MGINISEIVQGSGWKNFMKYLYGWGAALVLLGALFKLQYWPGAGTMLTIGMTVEVFIFFFSAFEPIHDEVDWTLVYPELAGMTDEEELRKYRKGSGMAGGLDPDDIKELIASVVAASSNLPAYGGQQVAAPAGSAAPAVTSQGTSIMSEKIP
jgi:gliding motility-associated protein GldL